MPACWELFSLRLCEHTQTVDLAQAAQAGQRPNNTATWQRAP